MLVVSCLDDLPVEARAERAALAAGGVQSLLTVKMGYAGHPIGVLAFCVQQERIWSDDIVDLITVVGEIFTNALQRKWTETALRQANEYLEAQIIQRTDALLHANRQLELSEERYRTLIETSPSAILLTDLNGTICFCNQQAARLFGYSSIWELDVSRSNDAITPLAFDDLIIDSTPHIQEIIESGNLRNIECTMCRKDGNQFLAEVNSSVVIDRQGQPSGLIVVVHDITARRKSEQALTEAYNHLFALNNHLSRSRDLLRAIFDGLEDGLLLLDGSGYVQTVNRSLAALFESSPEALIGQHWGGLYPRIAPDFPGHLAFYRQTNERSRRQRSRYRSSDGTIRILDVQTIALHVNEQETAQTIVRVSDVTETVQLQERVLQNERFAANGRLAASVAHEMNTPLQSVQTFLELAHIASESDRHTFLTYAAEETQRLGRIIRQLLDLYRPGASKLGLVEINELIERILLLMGKLLRDHRVVIERDLTSGLPALMGYADELLQVLLNLIVNAIDAMPGGGRLTIRTNRQQNRQRVGPAGSSTALDGAVMITISDSGRGINADLQSRIFEPFVTTKENGTGLGLSISRQIIEQHGGTISVASQPGQGSTFTIILPCLRPTIQEQAL